MTDHETEPSRLAAELARLGIRRALIVTSMMRSLHGAPLVALDIGIVLAAAGVEVDFFTLELGHPLSGQLAKRGFRCFDPATRPDGLYGARYDLVWGQHWPAYGFVFYEFAVTARYFALVSLSSYEPLETVHFLAPQANILVFNARSTRDETLAELPVAPSKPVGITGNAIPPDWFAGDPAPLPEDAPRNVAVVSNRRCDELRLAGDLLKAQGIAVRFVGFLDKAEFVDSNFVDRCDVVVTIGHTVQKALARGRPVYCYDRFGGPGYIDEGNLDRAETHNFSGRDCPLGKTPEQICAEILDGYAAAAAAAGTLSRIAAERYRLDDVLAGLLGRLAPRAVARPVRAGKLSAARKFVRYAVNAAVRYDLFTPESTMVAKDRLDFVRLKRTLPKPESIPYFREVNAPSPSLYAVSPQPRSAPVYGYILPAPGLEITAIEVHHDDGTVTTAPSGLPSPNLKDMFPDHPLSGVGRFNAHYTIRPGMNRVELIAVLSDGARPVFFVIEIEPVQPDLPAVAAVDAPG
jgi:hypothetical protein